MTGDLLHEVAPETTTPSTTAATVVVCTLGREPRLADTVDRLLGQTHAALDVVVVDNDPGSGRVRELLGAVDDPRLRIVDEPRRGLSVARNTGLAAAGAPVVAFTDDDAVPDPDWVAALVRVFDADPDGRVGCVTGLVLPAELDRPEHRWFEEFGGFGKGGRPLVWAGPADRAALAHLGAPGPRGALFPYGGGEVGSGNNMAFRTDVLRRLGGFDPALGAGSPACGGEDLDAFRAVLLSGAAIAYTPHARVRHHHRDTFAALRSQVRGYGAGMGAVVVKGLLSGPRPAAAILRRLPAAARVLLDPRSPKNTGKSAEYPAELTQAELRGFLAAPWRYALGRWRARRVPRPGVGGPGGPGLETSALSLMVSSAVTGLLGLVFWAATARGYPTGEVGRASAVISSATMLSTVANLSVGSMYERFLGLAGSRTRGLLLKGYALCGTLALLLGAGFLLLGPADRLFTSVWDLLTFPLLVMVLSMFALQDPILVGMRAAPRVAVKNVFHAVAKLVLVVALAFTASGGAVVWSWLVPAAVAAVVVNWLLFRRASPAPSDGDGSALPPVRELLQYFAASYALTVVSGIVPLLLPLLVISRFGAETNAYFAMAWTLAGAATLLLGTVGGPYVAEVASDPDLRRLPDLTRRFERLLVLVGGGGGLALFVLAPWILGLFGAEYAENATTLARLMAASLPLVAIGALYGGLARVYRRMRLAVVVQCVTAAIIVAGALALTRDHGITGVGLAYLGAQVVATLALAGPLWRLRREALRGGRPA